MELPVWGRVRNTEKKELQMERPSWEKINDHFG